MRTTWFVTPHVTVAGTDYLGDTPPEALHSMGALLTRIGSVLHRQGGPDGLVLVDEHAAVQLGLTEPATDDGRRQRALDAAAAAGWQSGRLGDWTQFYAKGRPTIHVGRVERIAGTAAQRDPDTWPWGPVWHQDITTGLQHWHRLTGIPWQAGPAVMGLELMRHTMTPYRIPGFKGQRRPDLHDDSTPHDASEPVWSTTLWSRPELAAHVHGYDKRRAGLTAAGLAKLAPGKLERYRRREFDPKYAGWWHVTVPGWARPELPHPMGPAALDKHRKTLWVCTATLELCAELQELGVFAMPEVIDSLTGLARPVLAPWQRVLEDAYTAPLDNPDAYDEITRAKIRHAVKEVGVRGIGMLNKSDKGTSILRRDWFYGINATKRANGWRKAWTIGQTEKRWPVAIDDDCLYYASDDPDPVRAAPKGLRRPDDPHLELDTAGGYRVQEKEET